MSPDPYHAGGGAGIPAVGAEIRATREIAHTHFWARPRREHALAEIRQQGRRIEYRHAMGRLQMVSPDAAALDPRGVRGDPSRHPKNRRSIA